MLAMQMSAYAEAQRGGGREEAEGGLGREVDKKFFKEV
jgi:hypothetical protein